MSDRFTHDDAILSEHRAIDHVVHVANLHVLDSVAGVYRCSDDAMLFIH